MADGAGAGAGAGAEARWRPWRRERRCRRREQLRGAGRFLQLRDPRFPGQRRAGLVGGASGGGASGGGAPGVRGRIGSWGPFPHKELSHGEQEGRPRPPALRGAVRVVGVSKRTSRGQWWRRGPGGELRRGSGRKGGGGGQRRRGEDFTGPPDAEQRCTRQGPGRGGRGRGARLAGTALGLLAQNLRDRRGPGLTSFPGAAPPALTTSPAHTALPAPPPNPGAQTPADERDWLRSDLASAQRAPGPLSLVLTESLPSRGPFPEGGTGRAARKRLTVARKS